MRICLICTEIFEWGKYGGFGRATRIIGEELVKRGVEVFAVIPRRDEQKEFEILNGIKVLGFQKANPFYSKKLIKACNADIYHSEEPSFLTYLAMKEMPHKYHIITSRDPKTTVDWIEEFIHPSRNKLQVLSNYLFENNSLVKKSVQNADRVFSAAISLQSKVSIKYSLNGSVNFLPTPIKIPEENISKAVLPTVCFVARWDKRKKPELFFQMVKSFPEIRFIAIGKGRNNNYDNYLREKYSHLKNLTITGFINQFENNYLYEILGKSWILVNTAAREGLPISFLEALANRCAILSSLNPENVTEHFGFLVKNNNFIEGMNSLLKNDLWRIKGEEGRKYVEEHYELNKAIGKHLSIYNSLLIK
ncbi:MAG: glycosyltransferase family 4 protein [Ignavibacteriaceae bacterium]